MQVHDIESNTFHEFVYIDYDNKRVVMKNPQYGHTSNEFHKVQILYDFAEYDKLPLECDGHTKVLSYLLTQLKIKHYVHTGDLTGPNGSIWHQWIELFDGQYIDYRARMWQGETAPHGVFDTATIKTVQYTSKTKEIWDVPEIYFQILTGTYNGN